MAAKNCHCEILKIVWCHHRIVVFYSTMPYNTMAPTSSRVLLFVQGRKKFKHGRFFLFFIMDSHFIVIDVIFKVIIWEKPFRRAHLLMILLWQLTPTSSQTFSIWRCAEKLCNGLQKRVIWWNWFQWIWTFFGLIIIWHWKIPLIVPNDSCLLLEIIKQISLNSLSQACIVFKNSTIW